MSNLLSFLLKCVSYIPFGVIYVISDCLYYILYYVVRYRRKVVRKNLTESFPEKNMQEIKSIEKKFYSYFVDQILETCKLATISPEEISRRMKFTNAEAVNAVFRSGKSVALYMGHYGNWEWVSSVPLCIEKEVLAIQIYHKLSNENVDKLMMALRERNGGVCVEMRKTARSITDLLAKQKVCLIGFIADQAPRKRDIRHFLPFLHHKTPVLTGSEKIIKHYGLEAWFLNIERVKRGYYEATFVQMHEAPQSLPDFELTDIYFRMLEKMILNRPELYLWSHNRFRSAEKLNV